MIDVRKLNFSYSAEKNILKEFSVSFTQGRVTSVLGRNGSGKSTLLKNINGILRPDSGAIYINSEDIREMSAKEIARQIGFLSQRSEGIDATVMDAVMTGRRPHINFALSSTDRELTSRTIKQMGLEELACRKTTEISGGELQKVVIARALVQEPKILLLDEPVNHLDMVNQLEVLGLIREITLERELTTAVVMHDINTAIRFSDELIFMKEGSVLHKCADGEITSEIIKDTFGLEAEIVSANGRPYAIFN